MYSTFVLPTNEDMRKKGKALRKTEAYDKVMAGTNDQGVKNSERLANLQVGFEGAQLKALDVATDILHNEGLLKNAVDVNEDGHITFSDLPASDHAQISNYLYTSNQPLHEALFMNSKGGTSVRENLIAVAGKGNYRKMMMGEFFEKGTKSFDAQALDWFISDTEEEINNQRDTYGLDEASKELLLSKQSWGTSIENVDVNKYSKLAGGVGALLFGTGAVVAATGLGAPVGGALMGVGGVMMAPAAGESS
jgi:hypothetical protein